MNRLMTWALMVVIAGCTAACSTAHEPVIDRSGVDDARYNRDLAACKQSAALVGFSNPVADCMTGKGYKVLLGK